MKRNDYDDNFDRHFASTRRTIGFGMFIGLAWILFLMGAIGTGLWMLGRWTGIW